MEGIVDWFDLGDVILVGAGIVGEHFLVLVQVNLGGCTVSFKGGANGTLLVCIATFKSGEIFRILKRISGGSACSDHLRSVHFVLFSDFVRNEVIIKCGGFLDCGRRGVYFFNHGVVVIHGAFASKKITEGAGGEEEGEGEENKSGCKGTIMFHLIFWGGGEVHFFCKIEYCVSTLTRSDFFGQCLKLGNFKTISLNLLRGDFFLGKMGLHLPLIRDL